MPDYKQLYLIMLDASEKVINILIGAQRKCEEIYVAADEPKIVLLSDESKKNEN